MVNLLGDLWSSGEPDWDRAPGLDPGVKLHLYGKRTPAPGRKMGHMTVLDPDPARALDRALDREGDADEVVVGSAMRTSSVATVGQKIVRMADPTGGPTGGVGLFANEGLKLSPPQRQPSSPPRAIMMRTRGFNW